MRCCLAAMVAAVLAGCVSLAIPAGPPMDAAEAMPPDVEDEKPSKVSFDLGSWLATPPEPHPKADEAMQAWIAERESVLAGTTLPSLSWHEQVRGYQRTSDESTDPFVKEVYRRVALDQYGRFNGPMSPDAPVALAARLGIDLDEAGGLAFGERLMRVLVGIDLDNTSFLQRELEARDGRWWTVADVGADPTHMIWLLTQHADQTPAFQQEALEKMKPLLEAGEIRRNNYAYLWDRVAVAQERPQRFGTQGRCVSAGNWQAFKIEAPAEEVNERRAAYGISVTFEENKARIDAMCPQ